MLLHKRIFLQKGTQGRFAVFLSGLTTCSAPVRALVSSSSALQNSWQYRPDIAVGLTQLSNLSDLSRASFAARIEAVTSVRVS